MDLEDSEKNKVQSWLRDISFKCNVVSNDTNQGTVIEQIDDQRLVSRDLT